MGEKWLYNAPIVVFTPSHFSGGGGGKLTMGGKWLYNTDSVSHYFPVGSPNFFFSRTGFVYVKNWKNSENSSISQLCFLFLIYLRFIITLVKDMFDLQIDKKKKQKIVFNE